MKLLGAKSFQSNVKLKYISNSQHFQHQGKIKAKYLNPIPT